MIKTILDHSSKFNSARDQGSRNTCLAFAVSDINAFSHQTDDLSIEYLCHFAAKNTPNWNGEGFQLDVMFSAVSNDGQPPEHLYPYCHSEPLKPLSSPPADLNPIYKSSVNPSGLSFDQITNEISNGNSVGIAIAVTMSLLSPNNGLVAYDANALVDTYHAMIATGYGENIKSNEKYIKVRNSWGASWGQDGYAWLPKSLIDLHLVGAFLI